MQLIPHTSDDSPQHSLLLPLVPVLLRRSDYCDTSLNHSTLRFRGSVQRSDKVPFIKSTYTCIVLLAVFHSKVQAMAT